MGVQQPVDHIRRSVDHVLAIVEHQQGYRAGYPFDGGPARRRSFSVSATTWDNEARTSMASSRISQQPPATAACLATSIGQSGLADPGRSDQGDQPLVTDQLTDGSKIGRPADQAA